MRHESALRNFHTPAATRRAGSSGARPGRIEARRTEARARALADRVYRANSEQSAVCETLASLRQDGGFLGPGRLSAFENRIEDDEICRRRIGPMGDQSLWRASHARSQVHHQKPRSRLCITVNRQLENQNTMSMKLSVAPLISAKNLWPEPMPTGVAAEPKLKHPFLDLSEEQVAGLPAGTQGRVQAVIKRRAVEARFSRYFEPKPFPTAN
jgi:hypothetical protein